MMGRSVHWDASGRPQGAGRSADRFEFGATGSVHMRSGIHVRHVDRMKPTGASLMHVPTV